MCHTGHRQKNYHSPLIGLPASTSPYLYTSILCTKEGSFFKSKSARVTSLLKTLQGLLMFLHDHKSCCLFPHLATWDRAFVPYRFGLPRWLSCRYLCGLLLHFLGSLAPESPSREAFPGCPIKNCTPSPFCLILPSLAPITIKHTC